MSRAGAARAFPWHALESTTHADVAALRDVRRWAAAHAALPRLQAVLSELLGARVEVIVRRAERVKNVRPVAGGAAVAIAPAEAPRLDRAAVVEAEAALVANAAMRVLKRMPPLAVDGGAPASPASSGALGAIVVAALRRAHAGVAMRVLAAGPAAALETDLARLPQELVAVALTVLVGDDAFEARIVLPRTAVVGAAAGAWDAGVVRALGATPLAMPVVAMAPLASTADVASLEVGDVLVLAGWPLERRGAEGTALAGPVLLAPPSSSMGIAARLAGDGSIVLGGEAVPLCAAAAEAEMSEAADQSGVIEAIGEVPVVVRVEIGEASLPAREWAALGKGDVLALGRRVGERVTLRIGGVPVARGDLVEIEGEVGVRIVERLRGEEPR